SILELAEAPLVRIGDERDELGSEDPVGSVGGGVGQIDLLVGNQQSVLDQVPIQARGHEQVVVLGERGIDLPVEHTLSREDETTGIPEGARMDVRGQSRGSVGIEGSGALGSSVADRVVRRVRKLQIRLQNTFSATAAPRSAPTRSWKT